MAPRSHRLGLSILAPRQADAILRPPGTSFLTQSKPANKSTLTDTLAQLLNSSAILLYVQGVLVLQPTHTAEQKKQGTLVHAGLNGVAFAAAVAGLVVIEINKFAHKGVHFQSPHAILGLITYILIIVQALVGFTQYFLPGLYGGVDNAKSVYKYHRMSGYVILVLMFATVCAATQTPFNENVLQMQLWAVIVASVITLAGILPRIKMQKLGFKTQ